MAQLLAFPRRIGRRGREARGFGRAYAQSRLEQCVKTFARPTEAEDEPGRGGEHQSASRVEVVAFRRDDALRRFDRESFRDRHRRVSVPEEGEGRRDARRGIPRGGDVPNLRPCFLIEGATAGRKRLEVDPFLPEGGEDRLERSSVSRAGHQILDRGSQEEPRLLETEGAGELP